MQRNGILAIRLQNGNILFHIVALDAFYLIFFAGQQIDLCFGKAFDHMVVGNNSAVFIAEEAGADGAAALCLCADLHNRVGAGIIKLCWCQLRAEQGAHTQYTTALEKQRHYAHQRDKTKGSFLHIFSSFGLNSISIVASAYPNCKNHKYFS